MHLTTELLFSTTTFFLFIFSFITNLFLGNFLYLLVNVLPNKSESTLNRQKLQKTNLNLKWFKHHNNEEYFSLLSHIPFFGMKIHQNKRIFKFEVLNAIFNSLIILIMFLANVYFTSDNLLVLSALVILWSVILTCWNSVFIIDLRHYIIPDIVNLILLISSLILLFFVSITQGSFLWINLWVGIGIFILFLVLGAITGGMGGGDVKFIISSGFIFGPYIIFLLLIASVFGYLYRGLLVPMFKINIGEETPEDIKGKKVLPFGPFMVLGGYMVLLLSPLFVIILTKYFQSIAVG